MNNKSGDGLSKKFWITLISICVIFIIVIVAGFVMFNNREEEVIEKDLEGGQITLNYTNNVTGLSLKNIVPTTDAIAMKDLTEKQYFDFFIDIDLKDAKVIEYEISAIKDAKESNISNDDVRIYLEKENSGTYSGVFGPSKYIPIKEDTKLGSEKGSMVLVKSKAKKSLKDNYRLRVWLSDKSLLPNGNYSVNVVVNGVAK